MERTTNHAEKNANERIEESLGFGSFSDKNLD